MVKVIDKISDISDSNVVSVMSKPSDIDQLQFLKLDVKIIKHIKKHISKKEDAFLEFFLWTTRFERLYVCISQKKDTKKQVEFLWNSFRKLPKKYTLLCLDEENIKNVVDTCFLSRHSFQDCKSKKDLDVAYAFVNSKTKAKVKERLLTIDNISFARDLGEMPSNKLTPEAFVKLVKSTKLKNTKVKVLSPKDIEKKGLGLIYAVWKGSENKPHMVILERIVDKKAPTYGVIGKGITFDTWGIQVKPGDSMYEMKWDMGGAAVTFSLMKELDRKDIKVNMIACLCLAENVISSSSYKPSDIIKWYTGKTVEVIHTDAEWRLVLADGISYVSKNYSPTNVITIATLTWAVMVALGFRHAGIMGTDNSFIKRAISYSRDNTEQYVELPFDDYFIEKTKSNIADFKNLDRKVHAGSSMGGAFLVNFLENNEKFTHIDIAGVYLNGGDSYGKVNQWASWFWVESLSEIFQEL